MITMWMAWLEAYTDFRPGDSIIGAGILDFTGIVSTATIVFQMVIK